MTITRKLHYSYKFPKLREYGVKLFSLRLILSVILIAIMFLYSSKDLKMDYLTQIIILLPSLYLTATILNMTFKINILIRRIIQVGKENANLSKKENIYKNQLLIWENEDKHFFREKKISIVLIILMIFFFLTKRLMIDIQYIKWGGGFVIILFLLISLRDISRYFYYLANTCYQIIIKDNKFTEVFLGKDIINWKEFEYKWCKALTLNIFLLLITVVIFYIYQDFKGTISLVSLLLAAFITFKIALDVDAIVKSNLEIMGEYDEYIKTKLGMAFLQSSGILPNYFEAQVTLESSIPTFIKISKKIYTAMNGIFRKIGHF